MSYAQRFQLIPRTLVAAVMLLQLPAKAHAQDVSTPSSPQMDSPHQMLYFILDRNKGLNLRVKYEAAGKVAGSGIEKAIRAHQQALRGADAAAVNSRSTPEPAPGSGPAYKYVEDLKDIEFQYREAAFEIFGKGAGLANEQVISAAQFGLNDALQAAAERLKQQGTDAGLLAKSVSEAQGPLLHPKFERMGGTGALRKRQQ